MIAGELTVEDDAGGGDEQRGRHGEPQHVFELLDIEDACAAER